MKRCHHFTLKWPTLMGGGLVILVALFPEAGFSQSSPALALAPKIFEIRIGTLAPPNTAWTNLPVKLLIPLIRDVTGGRMKITLHMSGTMGDDSEMLQKMEQGELEGCACISNGTLELVPELSVFSLPFFFSSYPEVNFVFSRMKGKIFSLFAGKGMILVALLDSGFYYLYSTNNPSSLMGIRQQTIGNWWGDFESTVLKELEINPISLTPGEILPALKSEIVDGVIAPPSWVLASQTFTQLQYRVEQPFFYSPGSVIISRKAINQITDELQKNEKEFNNLKDDFKKFIKNINMDTYFKEQGITDDQVKELARSLILWLKTTEIKSPEDAVGLVIQIIKRSEKTWTQMLRDFENESQAGLAQNGIKPVKLSEQDLKEMGKTAQKIQAGFIGKLYPQNFLDEALRLKQDFGEKTLQELY
ncbi:MAG: TRAP transporter substrate-binding protein DctP [bacterium]|nr:TRAP transporter substrate-binding protein DctP [bacterium]